MTEQSILSVTGAGGSLGQALVRRLCGRNMTVRALARKEKDLEQLAHLGAQPIQGDLRDLSSLKRLTEGSSVLFHLAAWIMEPFDPKLAHAVNVEGTRLAIRAAAESGCQRVVLASSVAVYGPRRDGVIDEDTPYWAVGDLYGDSKIQAEQVALEEAAAHGLELVILRPTMIYGPASNPWTVNPYTMIAKGLPVVIGSGRDLLDAVYVDDVARAFEMAAFHPLATGESFNVCGETVDWNTFMGHYADLAERKLKHLPYWIANVGVYAGFVVAKVLRKPPRVVPKMLGVMNSQARFDGTKAERLIGYKPEIALAEGMVKTSEWLIRHGIAKGPFPSQALVTGAAGGLGNVLARQLKQQGLNVWAADLSVEALTELSKEGINTIAMDVTSETSVNEAINYIEQESGPIDLLLNVAGILRVGPLESQPMNQCRQQFEVNTFGPLYTARAVAKSMRQRRRGRIINVSSSNGYLTTPFMGAYSASKYALESMSDALRIELKTWGIEVCLIQPGAMKTPFAQTAKGWVKNTLDDCGPDWHPYVEGFMNSVSMGGGASTSPEAVARQIVAAALSSKTLKPRIKVTTDAILVRGLSILPDGLKDFILARVAGLHISPAKMHARASRNAQAESLVQQPV